MQPVTADDVKLLLLRVETMLMPAEQRERISAWLEAKRDAIDGVDNRGYPQCSSPGALADLIASGV